MAQMAEIEQDAVAERIAQARRESGLTQQQVADILGITVRSYQDYEAGVTVPYKRLGAIADALGTSKRLLLHGESAEQSGLFSSDVLDAIREQTAEIRALREEMRRRLDNEGEAGSA